MYDPMEKKVTIDKYVPEIRLLDRNTDGRGSASQFPSLSISCMGKKNWTRT